MRVSELANELGKTSKEILEIIKTKDKAAVLYAASNVTKDQENIVRSFANPKRDAKPAAPEHRSEAVSYTHLDVYKRQGQGKRTEGHAGLSG